MPKKPDLPVAKIQLNNKRMSELICEQISDWIMDGTLEAGQRISEDELAERFGVSRMPVREAVRMLCAKGLMQSIPYVGSSVRKLSNDEIRAEVAAERPGADLVVHGTWKKPPQERPQSAREQTAPSIDFQQRGKA